MENPIRARRRKPETAKGNLKPADGQVLCRARDEGGPLGAAVQAEASNRPLLLRLKGVVVSELGKGRT